MPKTKENKTQSQGEIIKITGSVVDVVFDERSMPRIFDAFETTNNGKRLVL
jgi:F0F1-type ATP synthase beta subunit